MHRSPKLLALALLLAAPAAGAQQSPSPAASAPASAAAADSARFPCGYLAVRRQFDFWIGTWDVFPWTAPAGGGARLGTNTIAPIMRHCALLEQWTDAQGGTGQSFNWWDQNLRTWRQLWLAEDGGTLDYTQGEFRDGAMRFSGWTRRPGGRRVEQRLTFFHLHADTVRQLFESSLDSGRTWQPGFDGRYIRRAP
jgi:hypothetical protein